ncbi:MAG: (2Fe-2S)-binding protein [Pseudomonadota bacterium]
MIDRRSETKNAEIVVIGAGPAGLAAARTAGEAGRTVLVLDEQPAAGGQVWRNAAEVMRRSDALARSYHGAEAALAGLDNDRIDHRPGAVVIDARAEPAGATVTWLTREPDGTRRIEETEAAALIVATGAQERALAFPGAELAGVMGIGGVQTAMKQGGLVPKTPDGAPGLVLAGQGPLLLLTLIQIRALGGRVDAVLDLSEPGAIRRALPHLPSAIAGDPGLMADGARLLAGAIRGGTRRYRHVTHLRADGDDRVEQVRFRSAGREESLPCSILAVHDGVIPNTQVTRLLDLPHEWDEPQQAFRPRVLQDGRVDGLPVWIAGDGAGIAGAGMAGRRGADAGRDAAQTVGGQSVSARSGASPDGLAARRFIDTLYAPLPVTAHADNETLICRCEAVTLTSVRKAIADGGTGPNRVKTFTRCGMGPCQGRMCGNLLTRIIAEETGEAPDTVGALRIRPPLKPVLVADYLASDPAPVPEAVS